MRTLLVLVACHECTLSPAQYSEWTSALRDAGDALEAVEQAVERGRSGGPAAEGLGTLGDGSAAALWRVAAALRRKKETNCHTSSCALWAELTGRECPFDIYGVSLEPQGGRTAVAPGQEAGGPAVQITLVRSNEMETDAFPEYYRSLHSFVVLPLALGGEQRWAVAQSYYRHFDLLDWLLGSRGSGTARARLPAPAAPVRRGPHPATFGLGAPRPEKPEDAWRRIQARKYTTRAEEDLVAGTELFGRPLAEEGLSGFVKAVNTWLKGVGPVDPKVDPKGAALEQLRDHSLARRDLPHHSVWGGHVFGWNATRGGDKWHLVQWQAPGAASGAQTVRKVVHAGGADA